VVAASLILLAVSSSAFANDGWVGYSGAPRIEGKHPGVRMADELIRIRIGRDQMWADCSFTFKNEGPACIARVGFPDYDSHGEELRSFYSDFRSYVDGKRVKTTLVKGEEGTAWQVKSVPFRQGQTRVVRNMYRMQLGILSLNGPGKHGDPPRIQLAEYILSTGRSWRGSIGRSRVIFEFDRTSIIKVPIRAYPRSRENKFDDSSFWEKNNNLIAFGGPCEPKVSGRTLTFEKSNWKPTESDDISLTFGVYYKSY